MPPRKSKGTSLRVFSGKEATLNRAILLILNSKKLLAKYDVFLEIRKIKGLRHKDSKTIYRRVDALCQEGWIGQSGTRPAKVQGDAVLYKLMLKGKAALKLDGKNIETFLKTATNEKLAKFIGLLD